MTMTGPYGGTLQNLAALFSNTTAAQTWTGEVTEPATLAHVKKWRTPEPTGPVVIIAFREVTRPVDSVDGRAVWITGTMSMEFVAFSANTGDIEADIESFMQSVQDIVVAMEDLSDSDTTKLQQVAFMPEPQVVVVPKFKGHTIDVFSYMWKVTLP